MLMQIILLHDFDICISIVRLNRYVINILDACVQYCTMPCNFSKSSILSFYDRRFFSEVGNKIQVDMVTKMLFTKMVYN